MIQRLQTLFLIFALVANGLMLSFDFWTASATNDDGEVVEELAITLTSLQYKSQLQKQNTETATNIWLIGLYSLASFLAIVAIFLYRNRSLQLKISRLGMLLETGLLVLLFFYIDSAAEDYFTGQMTESSYAPGIFMPIVSVLCFFLANLFIMRDQRLVKSAERLR